MINFLLLFTISSIYLIADIFPRRPFFSVAFKMALFTSVAWAYFNVYDFYQFYGYDIFIFLLSNLMFVIYLLHFQSIRNRSFKYCVLSYLFVGAINLFFYFQFIYLMIYKIPILPVSINVYILFITQLIIYFSYLRFSSVTILPRLYANIDASCCFMVFSTVLLIFSYFFQPLYQTFKYIYYFSLYGCFFVPYLVKHKVLVLRHYFRAFVFSLLFVVTGVSYFLMIKHTNFILIDSPFKLTFFLVSAGIFPLFFLVFDKLSLVIDSLKLFSMVDSKKIQTVIQMLGSVTESCDIKEIFQRNHVFYSADYNIHLWYREDNDKYESFTDMAIKLDDDILSFMQFKEIIYFSDFDFDFSVYNQTPLSEEFAVVYQFMREHNMLMLSLLQKSNNVVGFFGVSYLNRYCELSDYDAYQLSLLQDAVILTFSNLNYVKKMKYHQQMMEYLNMSISSFSNEFSDDEYYAMIQACCLRIVPEVRYSLILEYDELTHYYKQPVVFNNQDYKGVLKFHKDSVADILGNDLYVTVSIHQDISYDFVNLMNALNVEQMTFIRSNDDHAFIFVMLYESTLNLSYYRISFCQVFLTQVESFFQYQKASNELTSLEHYLRDILDQLPIGILIVNSDRNFVYLNSKVDHDICVSGYDHLNDALPAPIKVQIDDVVESVFSSNHHVIQQVEFDCIGVQELYLVSAFPICLDNEVNVIVVLTNIQQSKELFEQMNQTNRLAMMSKIATGISFELNRPVEKLIDAIHLLKYQWNSYDFQSYFKTDVIPQVDRINLLCQSLLRLSRSSSESLNEVYLPDIVEQVLRLIAGDLRYQKHKFYVSSIDKVVIVVDQVMAIQILMNLLIFSFKSLAVDNSKVFLDFVVTNLESLTIKIRIDSFNEVGFSNGNDLKDQLELSIVNQIVLNQNGTFDIFRDQHLAVLDVQLPISKYLNKKLSMMSES